MISAPQNGSGQIGDCNQRITAYAVMPKRCANQSASCGESYIKPEGHAARKTG